MKKAECRGVHLYSQHSYGEMEVELKAHWPASGIQRAAVEQLRGSRRGVGERYNQHISTYIHILNVQKIISQVPPFSENTQSRLLR